MKNTNFILKDFHSRLYYVQAIFFRIVFLAFKYMKQIYMKYRVDFFCKNSHYQKWDSSEFEDLFLVVIWYCTFNSNVPCW